MLTFLQLTRRCFYLTDLWHRVGGHLPAKQKKKYKVQLNIFVYDDTILYIYIYYKKIRVKKSKTIRLARPHQIRWFIVTFHSFREQRIKEESVASNVTATWFYKRSLLLMLLLFVVFISSRTLTFWPRWINTVCCLLHRERGCILGALCEKLYSKQCCRMSPYFHYHLLTSREWEEEE